MASAGQAHAHSSHPTHFSRPSGCRLSWWRPWNRGAVGFLYSGYCSVSRFLNMALKVTPKPATGPRNSGIAVLLLLLLRGVLAGCSDELGLYAAGPARHALRLLPGQRRYGVAAGHRVEPVRRRQGPARALLRLVLAVPEEVGEQRDEQQDEHGAGDVQHDLGEVVVLVAHRAHRGHQHQPDHGDRDEDLPADLHQLVVAHP